MLSNQMISIITMGSVVVVTLGVMLGILPYLKKKGVNIEGGLSSIEKTVDTADKIFQVLRDKLPDNNVVNVLEIIDKAAQIGVGDAEQLCHVGNISKDERSQVAQDVVYSILKELSITVDDSRKALIDAAIKNAVNDLGHASQNAEQQKSA